MNFVKLPTKEDNRGFTLIEILVVIGIIAVLAAIVLIAINPARQFQQARDTERRSNVTAILDAVGQYIADNQGTLPPSITAELSPGDAAAAIGSGTGEVDLCDDLLGDYLPAMPQDPENGDGADLDACDGTATYDTGYNIEYLTSERITISAPDTEVNDEDSDGTVDPIAVTR